jgi:aminoglycoside phosphotransferase (APT) family kinase protein
MEIEGASHSHGTPVAEFDVDSALVAKLLESQHPDLAQLPIIDIDSGWDNAIFRLGDRLAVRLPRRASAARLISHEQRWLPQLAAHLPLPVPTPYRVGMPGVTYPWRWSVVPWLPGQTANRCQLRSSEAKRFGNFLRALHIPAASDAPQNAVRGGPLRLRAPAVEARMERLAAITKSITDLVRQVWREALETPIDVAPTWLHGDLHPRNVLVEAGKITGIIDWGDITAGDPATDLASIWMLFPEPHEWQDALAAYSKPSEATIRRAKAWAVLLGIALLDSGLVDNPIHAAIGERILSQVARSVDRDF